MRFKKARKEQNEDVSDDHVCLLPAKRATRDQGDDELSDREMLRLRMIDDVFCQDFIGEAIGPAKRILNKGPGEAAGEVFALGGDLIAQGEVVLEGGAVVKLTAGVDGPVLFWFWGRDRRRAICLRR